MTRASGLTGRAHAAPACRSALRAPATGPTIDYVRVALVRGDATPCVAFDVKASSEEKAAFFARVDGPTDRPDQAEGTVFAAFDISPPALESTVARLLALRDRIEA